MARWALSTSSRFADARSEGRPRALGRVHRPAWCEAHECGHRRADCLDGPRPRGGGLAVGVLCVRKPLRHELDAQGDESQSDKPSHWSSSDGSSGGRGAGGSGGSGSSQGADGSGGSGISTVGGSPGRRGCSGGSGRTIGVGSIACGLSPFDAERNVQCHRGDRAAWTRKPTTPSQSRSTTSPPEGEEGKRVRQDRLGN
jgi:hypothetical protein